jgi:hypothetical protein
MFQFSKYRVSFKKQNKAKTKNREEGKYIYTSQLEGMYFSGVCSLKCMQDQWWEFAVLQ